MHPLTLTQTHVEAHAHNTQHTHKHTRIHTDTHINRRTQSWDLNKAGHVDILWREGQKGRRKKSSVLERSRLRRDNAPEKEMGGGGYCSSIMRKGIKELDLQNYRCMHWKNKWISNEGMRQTKTIKQKCSECKRKIPKMKKMRQCSDWKNEREK